LKIEIIKPARIFDAVEAWRLSRDTEADYRATDVIAVDAPVSEMPSALLNFTNFTIIEREIFCSLRNHCVWARTSRVDDPTLFTVPPELVDVNAHHEYRKQMLRRQAKGMPQDQWRMLLPIVAHTAWTQRIHVRDLAKLILYFKYLSQKCFINNLEMCGRFNAVSLCLTDVLQKMLEADCTKALLDSVKLAKFLNEKAIELIPSFLRDEFFMTVHCIVPIALRAQIVRHRELQFVDNFLQILVRPDVAILNLSHPVQMIITARRDIWRSVMAKRTCWLAQTDLWESLTRYFDADTLPCADGNCPYKVDVEARLNNKDPGIPCPRYCNLYEVDKTPWLARMRDAARHRGGELWKKELT